MIEKTLIIGVNILIVGFMFGWIFTPFVLFGGIYLWQIDSLIE